MTDARGALALRGSFPLPQEPSNAGAGDLVEFTDLIRALPLESAPATPRTGLLGRVEPADRPGLNDCTSARIAPTVHANNHSVLVEGRLGAPLVFYDEAAPMPRELWDALLSGELKVSR